MHCYANNIVCSGNFKMFSTLKYIIAKKLSYTGVCIHMYASCVSLHGCLFTAESVLMVQLLLATVEMTRAGSWIILCPCVDMISHVTFLWWLRDDGGSGGVACWYFLLLSSIDIVKQFLSLVVHS